MASFESIIQGIGGSAAAVPVTAAQSWFCAITDGVSNIIGTAAHPIIVSAGSGDFGVNIDKWGNTSTTLGQKVLTASVPVAIASDTPSALFAAPSPTASPSYAVLVGGTYTTSPPTLTSGEVVPFQFDANGQLKTAGSAGGTLTNNNAAPTNNNQGVLPAVANAAAQSWIEGNQVLMSVDLAGNQRVVLKAETTKVIGTINVAASQTIAVTQATAANLNATVTGSGLGTFPASDSQSTLQSVTFTSGTSADVANTVAIGSYANVAVSLHYSGSVTGGLMYFEVSNDNSNWYGISMAPTAGVSNNPAESYVPTSANGNISWQMFVGAFTYFRVRMHTPVVGAGSAIVGIIASTLPSEPAVALSGGTAAVTVVSGGIASGAIASGAIASGAVAAGAFAAGAIADGAEYARVRPSNPTTALWTHATIAISAATGTQSLIGAGGGSTTIRVMAISFTTNAAVNFYFLDSTPTTLSGTYVLTGNGGSFSGSLNGEPLYICAANKAFEINLSGTVTVGGDVWYTVT